MTCFRTCATLPEDQSFGSQGPHQAAKSSLILIPGYLLDTIGHPPPHMCGIYSHIHKNKKKYF